MLTVSILGESQVLITSNWWTREIKVILHLLFQANIPHHSDLFPCLLPICYFKRYCLIHGRNIAKTEWIFQQRENVVNFTAIETLVCPFRRSLAFMPCCFGLWTSLEELSCSVVVICSKELKHFWESRFCTWAQVTTVVQHI